MCLNIKYFMLLLTVAAVVTSEFTELQEEKWKNFKLQYGKLFLSTNKEKERKVTFFKNVAAVEEHNEKYDNGEVTYSKAIHQYSDLTDEAFIARFGGVHMPEEAKEVDESTKISLRGNPPDSLDYRLWAGMNPIRDQQSCGSCWAFSTIAAVEFCYYRWTFKPISLSEQELVDCVYGTTRSGCNGGWMPTAMEYIARNGGSANRSAYPYTAVYGTCQKNVPKAMQLKYDAPWLQFKSDDNSTKIGLNSYGVMSVCVDCTGWGSYSTGIFRSPKNGSYECQHAVALVGYGSEKQADGTIIPFWIIRNSWNTWWGEKGYMRLDARRNATTGAIYGGIMLQYAYYPRMY